MKRVLFVVDPELNVFVGRCADISKCKSEAEIERRKLVWQGRVGENLVVLDSKISPGWIKNEAESVRMEQRRTPDFIRWIPGFRKLIDTWLSV